MKMYTKEEYKKLTGSASKNSPIIKNCLNAFLFGGGICTLGQVFFSLYSYLNFDEKTARTFVSVTLIFLSAILTAFGIYDKIAKRAGAGTLVPITGFANSVVAPAMEFKQEGVVTGLGVKMFFVSGPVIVFGISLSVLYGIILFFIKFFGGEIA